MFADRVIGLLADVVLDLAGVLLGGFFVHTECNEKFRERVVAVEHLSGDGHAAVGQRDETVAVHLDIAVFAQTLGRIGHAGLCHAEVLRHVNGANVSVLELHHQHGLEIILGGLLDLHRRFHQLFCQIVFTD